MNIFMLEESPVYQGKYIISINGPDFDKYKEEFGTSGSLNILKARLLNLTYADFLRFSRDILGAELIGKNSIYVIPYFENNSNTKQFVKLLNARLELVLTDKKNPLSKYRRAGLLRDFEN